jgi:hypothetical protein
MMLDYYRKNMKPTVFHFRAMHRIPPIFVDELMSVATLALVVAAHKFDAEHYSNFPAYAYRCIYYRMVDFLREEIRYSYYCCGRMGEEIKVLRFPKLAKQGSEYRKWQNQQIHKRKLQQRRADGDDAGYDIDILAFRRSIYAESGVLF